jgi:hypothetical protein
MTPLLRATTHQLGAKSRPRIGTKLIESNARAISFSSHDVDGDITPNSTRTSFPSVIPATPYRWASTLESPSSSDHTSRSWQALHNIDIQRVTQTAMIHELSQQQTASIEKVVPWFLHTMPAQYFRQVPGESQFNTLFYSLNII